MNQHILNNVQKAAHCVHTWPCSSNHFQMFSGPLTCWPAKDSSHIYSLSQSSWAKSVCMKQQTLIRLPASASHTDISIKFIQLWNFIFIFVISQCYSNVKEIYVNFKRLGSPCQSDSLSLYQNQVPFFILIQYLNFGSHFNQT